MSVFLQQAILTRLLTHHVRTTQLIRSNSVAENGILTHDYHQVFSAILPAYTVGVLLDNENAASVGLGDIVVGCGVRQTVHIEPLAFVNDFELNGFPASPSDGDGFIRIAIVAVNKSVKRGLFKNGSQTQVRVLETVPVAVRLQAFHKVMDQPGYFGSAARTPGDFAGICAVQVGSILRPANLAGLELR